MKTVKLELAFKDELDKKFNLSLDDPKEKLTSEEIEEVANRIIAANIFSSEGLDIIKFDKARRITREVEEL